MAIFVITPLDDTAKLGLQDDAQATVQSGFRAAPLGMPSIGGCGTSDHLSQSVLFETFRAIPRMQLQLEHIETTVTSMSKQVSDLTNWKNRILGGVAVLALLWAGAKAVSDYVHISVGKDSDGMSTPTVP